MEMGSLFYNLLLIGTYLVVYLRLSFACPIQCICNPRTRKVDCDSRGDAPKLTQVPKDIPINTEKLTMKNNSIFVIKAGSFKLLTKLKQLHLQQCRIMAIEDNALEGLLELEHLDLSFNNLKFLPRQYNAFKDLRSLQVLKLQSSKLNIIPDQLLSPLKNLTVLDLYANGISNSTFGMGFQNLTKLKIVTMSNNNISTIANGTFNNLSNVSLKALYLKSCNIQHINKNAFEPLRKLQELYLGSNYQLKMSKANFDSMIHILCAIAKIKGLQLKGINLRHINGTFNKCSELTHLDLSFNNIGMLQNGVFNFPNNLIKLVINNSSMTQTEEDALLGLQHLKVLSMQENKLTRLPKFASKHGKRYIPHAAEVNFDYNFFSDDKESLTGLESVKKFSLRHNKYLSLNSNFLSPLTSVEELYLSNNSIRYIDPNTFLGLGTLKKLSLEYNPLVLRGSCNYFKNLTNLRELVLLNVNIKSFVDKTSSFDCLFEDLTNLDKLYMQSSKLKYLPVGFFKNLRKLTQLMLRDNAIVEWDPEVFRNLSSLKYLDISVNAIQTINHTSLMYISSTLTRLDADANPFICSCQLIWFINWIEQKNNTKNFTFINNDSAKYRCATPPNMQGKTIFSYKPSAFECLSNTLRIVLYCCGGSLICLIILTACLSYYFRWHIRYCWFLLGSDKMKVQDETERMLYEYDCYVTYSEDDDGWVLGTLLRKLEQEYQFRLCVHQRNFDLGGDKAENADKHIGNSRKMLVILTKNFVNNGWCKFELDLGNAKRLDENKSRDTLIIVMKEDVPMALMTPILRYLVRKKTYISWTEDYQGQTLFWQKLKEAIHMPITTNYGCHENGD